MLSADFAAWVMKQPDDTVLGVAQDGCNCPVAAFLKATGNECVYVGPRIIHFGVPFPDTRETVTPADDPVLFAFVSRIDSRRREGTPVTAAQVKQIIAERKADDAG